MLFRRLALIARLTERGRLLLAFSLNFLELRFQVGDLVAQPTVL